MTELPGPFSYLGRYRARIVLGVVTLILTIGFALAVPMVLGTTIEAIRGDNPAQQVPMLAILMVGLAIAQAAARVSSRVLLFNAARMAEYDLRSQLFSHLLTLDPAYFRDHSTGDIMSRLTSDVQTVRAMWGPGILNVVNTSLLYGIALVLMVDIDPWLTLWVLIPYPSMVLLGLFFGKQIYKASRRVQKELGGLSASVQEDLAGAAVIKNYGLEDVRAEHFAKSSLSLLGANMYLTKIRGSLGPAMGAIASFGTVVLVYKGAEAVINDRITLGQMVTFSGYLALLVWPTLALGWMISLLQRGRASWARLSAILLTEPHIVDGDGPAVAQQDIKGDVEIRGLTVAYGDLVVIDDLTLSCPAGTTTAIVGRVGAGKSTIVEAIPRLFDLEPETVFLDGRDVTTMRVADLRNAIGYAPQEAFLFSASIGDNIAFGYERLAEATGTEPDPSRLEPAARAAGLTRDLDALPAGYDTMVGERGVTLSGGQRQRVALARALATDPKVLILDDSLSSVDAETEKEILDELSAIMRDRTSILISHRVAAVQMADQIAVLDAGKLVELGSHVELLAAGGTYAELYKTQLSVEDVT